MNIRVQIVVGVIIILALFVIVNMIREKELELRYALTWLGVGIVVLDCFPQAITWLAVKAGVANPINMLFFLGFCFSLVIIFVLTIAVSRMSNQVKKLAQEVALFEESNKSNR